MTEGESVTREDGAPVGGASHIRIARPSRDPDGYRLVLSTRTWG